MRPILSHLWPLAIALAGVMGLTAQGKSANDSEEIPSLTKQTVARLSGLDPQTLLAAGISPDVQRRIRKHVSVFFKQQRPRLMTHRAIWAEMVERHKNLASSASKNVFDPCQFVTDEALEKVQAQVRSARDRFREACRKANRHIASLVSEQQFRLIENAGINSDLPAPYRWLALNQEQRKAVQRVVRVYEARRKLADKYPHLKEKLSAENQARTIAGILPQGTQERLAMLHARLEKLQPQQP